MAHKLPQRGEYRLQSWRLGWNGRKLDCHRILPFSLCGKTVSVAWLAKQWSAIFGRSRSEPLNNWYVITLHSVACAANSEHSTWILYQLSATAIQCIQVDKEAACSLYKNTADYRMYPSASRMNRQLHQSFGACIQNIPKPKQST